MPPAVSLVAIGGPRSIAQAVGAAIGFCGVFVVLSARLHDGVVIPGVALVFLGTLAFSFGTVFYRTHALHHDAVALNGVQNLVGALMLLPFVPAPMAPFHAMSDLPFLLPFLHLVVAVSIASFLIWLALVRKIGAAHAASVHLLNPVFGVMLSAAVFGTTITSLDLIGTAIVIAGLTVVTWDSVARASFRAAP
jgi:drug/metabolite transporter (DMT)-like permease